MAVVLWAAACGAQQISSAELIVRAAEYDNTTVVFRGEVIGDVMVRGDYAWVNLLDGGNALGVWMRAHDTLPISMNGAYLVRGDTVEVRGIFHRSCSEHGGDLDIHAGEIAKVSSGSRLSAEPLAAKITIAAVLALVLGATWTLKLFMRR